MSIAAEPSRHGGLVATHELHARGYRREHIASAVRLGVLYRVRQGWYSSPDLALPLARSARIGGLATCVTALAAAGLWVDPKAKTRLHVAVGPHACQLRSARDSRLRLGGEDAVIHWTLRPALRAQNRSRVLNPVADSLLDYAACGPAEVVAATANSWLHAVPGARAEWPALLPRFPERMRSQLALVDGVCESGGEFVFWSRIDGLRRRMRRQVWIPGVGRLDFLIGERLVVEIDGFGYHGGRDEFEADRHRDALVSTAGYRSLRFSQKLVLERWPLVEAAVYSAIARGDHL